MARRQFVGVVHLMPLPGSPRGGPGLAEVEARAVADARALADGGADLAIVENFGDAPFARGSVDAATVALMTRITCAIRTACPDLAVGINVLRNDAIAAVAIAAATDAQWIRVNVPTGAAWTDQGLITSDARATLLERRRLGVTVRIAADVAVKHATPAGTTDLAQLAHDTWTRSGVDALLVTGTATGAPADPSHLATVRIAAPHAPVWVASGVALQTVGAILANAHGAIVGTALHRDGDLAAPLDPARVRAMRTAIDALGEAPPLGSRVGS